MAIEQRYMRNVNALSEDECERLHDARVAVIGCGGLGGYVIESLARIGVGTHDGALVVVDGDTFEASNLNRQLFCTEALIDTSKACAAAGRVTAINSSVNVTPVKAFLDEGNAADIIAGCDCVVDCLDGVGSRLVLAHAASMAGMPLVHGSIAGWYGQVSTIYPGDASFSSLYGSKDLSARSGIERTLGNLPFTAACIASIQASQCVHVLLDHEEDVLRNRLLCVDLSCAAFEVLEL